MIHLSLSIGVVLVTILSGTWAPRCWANSSYETQTLKAIDFIEDVFSVSYAPKEWKRKQSNWDLLQVTDRARQHVAGMGAELDQKSAQQILRKLLGSAQDYHVAIHFYGTENASLPIEIRSAENRFFVVWIDRKKLPEKSFPVKVGDEITSFRGRPVLEERDDVLGELNHNVSETDQSLSEMYLTRRFARTGLKVPSGPVDIEVNRTDEKETKTISHQLIWDYEKEKIGFSLQSEPVGSLTEKKSNHHLADLSMTWGNWFDWDSVSEVEEENPYRIGSKKSYVPEMGSILWKEEKDKKFHAYTFRTDEGQIYGFIRIPSYGAGESEAKEFLGLIEKMEKQTDALLIDQVNNPGGSVFYLYALVSMLTDKPLITPKHRMAITQYDVNEALDDLDKLKDVKTEEEAKKVLGETMGGYPISYQLVQFFRSYSQFLVDEWNRGARLTSPYFLGIDKVLPHPEHHYTKPILVLINETDFSGGDFFPAILQDNQRARLMGVRTAGAGGYVRGVSFPNFLGISGFSVTSSIAERVDLNPIENLGVTPDVSYSLTAEDYQKEFAPYKKKILAELQSMVAK
ncbi:MAG: protease-like activity factor CPAF [Bdellovibrionales bacterium]|nr:protease-like activity factor CPAF [Bdellovibrionales bacterium]